MQHRSELVHRLDELLTLVTHWVDRAHAETGHCALEGTFFSGARYEGSLRTLLRRKNLALRSVILHLGHQGATSTLASELRRQMRSLLWVALHCFASRGSQLLH